MRLTRVLLLTKSQQAVYSPARPGCKFLLHELTPRALLPGRRIDHALRSSASGRSNLVQLKEAVRLLQQCSAAPSSQVSNLLKAAGDTASAIGTSAASSLSRSLSGASAIGSSAAEGVARGFADVARQVAEVVIQSDDGLKASLAMDIDMTSPEAPTGEEAALFGPQGGEDVFAMLQSAVTAQRTAKAAKKGFKVLSEEDGSLAGRKEPVVYVPLELAANVTDSKPVQVQVRVPLLVILSGVFFLPPSRSICRRLNISLT